jgi:hypothetical protein
MNNQTLLDLLTLALPYVEDCAENPAYKREAVNQLVRRINNAIRPERENEAMIEKLINALDNQLMTGRITQAEYDQSIQMIGA